ncbi:MAG: PAC2 family protein [archaeon]
MAEWRVTVHKKIKINSSVLIEGMPGIGNVGKIAADIIVEQLKAEKIASFFSHCLPNSVFVKENNMVGLPKIELYHKRKGKQDFIFLVGDVQPMQEEDSYSFTEAVLDTIQKLGYKEIIALGGIGLSEPPKESRIFCTGNDKKFIDEFVKLGVSNKLYGFVGPIMGITGLLLGLSKERNMRAVTVLAETYASPMHVGFREAKGLLGIIEKKYKLGLSMDKVEKDIKAFEGNLKPNAKQQELAKSKLKLAHQDTNYIG